MNRELNKLIGGRLRALRIKKKVSQGELARHLGFKSVHKIYYCEKGEKCLSVEDLRRAAAFFNADINYFIEN